MNLKNLQKQWDIFGKTDPLWAICSWDEKKGNKWNTNDFFAHGKKEIEDVISYIRSLGIKLPYKRALDFGCGVGRLTQALAEYFEEVHGVDIAPSMIKLADRYNRDSEKCRYHLNAVNNLNLFPNNYFDFIYSNITLQHIQSRYSKNYIKEFLRILSSDGLLVFQLLSEPINTRLKNQIKLIPPADLIDSYLEIRSSNIPIMEVSWIKKGHIIEFLKKNGAEIVDIKQNQTTGEKWSSFTYYARKKTYSNLGITTTKK